jgi:hydroxyacylglutathione hydrolase
MEFVASGVRRIVLPPLGAVNAYLVEDVLIDSGYAPFAGKLLAAIAGEEVRALALTHAHGDHAGGAKKVCAAREIPYWVPEGDAAAAAAGRPVVRESFGPARGPLALANGWPGRAPDSLLSEGAEVAGFTVLDAPGHTPGHVIYWREADRVAIAGDVFFNLNLLTLRPGLRPPPKAFTPDPERNRESMRRLAGLEPEIVCFGHGPVLRTDAAATLRSAAA